MLRGDAFFLEQDHNNKISSRAHIEEGACTEVTPSFWSRVVAEGVGDAAQHAEMVCSQC